MNPQVEQVATISSDYGGSYFASHLASDEDYSWESTHWRGFFTMVAERIVSLANPGSVLDVGCAKGLLVQALRSAGVACEGVDISTYAIESAHPAARPYLRVASAETVTGIWDLVTCIEVLEHMSPDAAERTIDAMCNITDRVLISSTPSDFNEPTHINVRQPAAWAASFAERGFYRRTDVDLGFITPWAVLFERADLSNRDIVHRYESYSYPMRVEVLDKRSALLDLHRQLSELKDGGIGGFGDSRVADLEAALAAERATTLDLRHRLMTSRDHAMGAEAESARWREEYQRAEVRHAVTGEVLRSTRVSLDEALTQLAIARQELLEAQEATCAERERVELILASESWRLGAALVRPFAKLTGRRQAAL